MGILRNLFGGKNNTPPPAGKEMNEDLFWQIIAGSRRGDPPQDEQQEKLTGKLSSLTPAEIISFYLTMDRLLDDIHTSSTWCAAYIMNEGCSDDGFDYFCAWVLSLGKETYYAAKKDPDNLVTVLREDSDEHEFEGMLYVAAEAYETKTGKSMYDQLPELIRKNANVEIEWDEDDPESMKKICPRLFAAKEL